MSRSTTTNAALALHRFGMGPRPGSIAAVSSDPRGALIAELDKPGAGQVAAAALPASAKAYRMVIDANAKRQARSIVIKRERDAAKRPQTADAPVKMETAAQETATAEADKAALEAVPDPGRLIYLDEARVHYEAALTAEIGFVERLVWFWCNHFCISADKVQSMSGAYEREAIRPHVLGRFTDLVLAAEGHPAMLIYLDNNASMGANSTAGINRTRGLNENLAREIMELHTLGVRTGYTQADVIAFANVLTGWTLLPVGDNPEHGGEFSFNPRLHEPGAQTIMGKSYDGDDAEQGRAVLRDLAKHPATATHVAAKLARHFISDAPPAALVEQMAKVFSDTDGDLKAVTKAMIISDEAWDTPPGKLKRPSEWMIGMVRATGLTEADPVRFTGGQTVLGERLWRPTSPRGYPDDEASWIDGVGRRLDAANNFAERLSGRIDPQDVIENVLGSQVSAEVKQAVGRAESRQQALALLFMSAEMLRR